MSNPLRVPLATATLLVRLADGAPRPDARFGWHAWDADEDDAAPGALASAARTNPRVESPYKRYPQAERPYFARHVERVLTPSPSTGPAGRWRRCLADHALLVGAESEVTDRWRIDLDERLHVPIAGSHAAYALLHLSLEQTQDSNLLEVASRLRAAFRRSDVNWPRWELEAGGARREIRGRRPLHALVEARLGPPHEEMERRSYWVLAAPEPLREETDPLDVAAFRRALANHSRRLERGRAAIVADPDKAQRQQVSLGPFMATVLGRATAVTAPGAVWGTSLLYNLRSFWGEALLMGLLQDDELDRLAARLADLNDDPLDRALEDLHQEWLSFRNRLWWSKLSPVTDVPQLLLNALRREQGSPAVFDELNGDFASYIAWRRQRAGQAQADGVAHLQVYGATFAVVGSLGALAAIVSPSIGSWAWQLALVLAIAVAGVVTYLVVRDTVAER